MEHDEAVQMLKSIAAAFDRHDLAAILEHFADDAVFDSPRGPDRWGQRPASAWVKVTGGGDTYTGVGRMRYPDGKVWHIIMLVRVRGGRIVRNTSYFAEPFDAPEWRQPFTERIDGAAEDR